MATLLALLLVALPLTATAHDAVDAWRRAGCSRKADAMTDLARRAAAFAPIDRATRPIDVQHVDLFVAVDDSLERIDARMEASIVALAPANRLVLDLEDESTRTLGLVVSGVWVDGTATTFTHGPNDTLAVDLPAAASAGDTTRVRVDYGGVPLAGRSPGFGLRFTNFLDEEFQGDPEWPVVQTLSQPVAARTWWPCHDHPADAATVRLTVEMPAGFQLAAPGLRESVETLGDGRVRQTNSMPRPIPSYLVSMIVAEFERWTEPLSVTELLPDGSSVPREIELVYYAPSFRRDDAAYTWQNTATMMQRYEALWGPYPYADVKYGNALFNGVVAMEHPTLSSIGDSPFTVSGEQSTLYAGPVGELVNAHELTHQWFGNAIRLARWGDIWLNEGFARYGEVLWLEEFYGEPAMREYLELMRGGAPFWSGPLRDPDPGALFTGVTYDKGAWVLHMLRQVMGREGLMTAMRNYATDPALRHAAPVTVEDFQSHCESVAGADLDWFFEPWLTRTTLPQVRADWTIAGERVDLVLEQPESVYEIPLPVRLQTVGGATIDRIARIDAASNSFTLEADAEIRSIEIDPERDWLVEIERPVLPRIAIERVVPNPFNPSTTVSFVVGSSARVRVDVVDVRGRKVRLLEDAQLDRGRFDVEWDGRDGASVPVASGTYFVRLDAGGEIVTAKVALVR